MTEWGQCVTHHFACDCREHRFREALMDCINRPMGVVPDSVYELFPDFSTNTPVGGSSLRGESGRGKEVPMHHYPAKSAGAPRTRKTETNGGTQ